MLGSRAFIHEKVGSSSFAIVPSLPHRGPHGIMVSYANITPAPPVFLLKLNPDLDLKSKHSLKTQSSSGMYRGRVNHW